MSVLIQVGQRKAILRQGEWRCADPHMENWLNVETKRWIQQTGGPRLEDADHEAAVAREMARRLGGRILLRVRTRGSGNAVAYIPYRQLELEFAAAAGVNLGWTKPSSTVETKKEEWR
jgi:hypothetical protein